MTGRIGYVLSTFPLASETFVAGEVARLSERGLDLDIVSMSRLQNADDVMRLQLLAQGIEPCYLLDSRIRMLARALSFGFRHPAQSFELFRMNVQLPVPERASRLSRFLKALAVCRLAQRRGWRHMHSHWSLPTDVALLVSTATGISFSFSAHAHDIYDDGPDYERQRPGFGLSHRIDRAAFVATCTRRARDYLANLVPSASRKLHLVYHGVDLALFDGNRHRAAHPPLIVAIGRLVAYKGFDRLIAACEVLARRGVAFRCVVIGDGSQRQALSRQILCADLGHSVELLGGRPHEEVRDWLRRAEIFVFCGDQRLGQYGLPNVLAEAMAMRVCTITTALPEAYELIDDGANGIVVEGEEELVESLERVLVDVDLRRRLGECGRRDVERRFDSRRTIRDLEHLLLEAIGVAPSHEAAAA
jgi:glycosyltransferase involved in cell wall biosynthesis